MTIYIPLVQTSAGTTEAVISQIEFLRCSSAFLFSVTALMSFCAATVGSIRMTREVGQIRKASQ